MELSKILEIKRIKFYNRLEVVWYKKKIQGEFQVIIRWIVMLFFEIGKSKGKVSKNSFKQKGKDFVFNDIVYIYNFRMIIFNNKNYVKVCIYYCFFVFIIYF